MLSRQIFSLWGRRSDWIRWSVPSIPHLPACYSSEVGGLKVEEGIDAKLLTLAIERRFGRRVWKSRRRLKTPITLSLNHHHHLLERFVLSVASPFPSRPNSSWGGARTVESVMGRMLLMSFPLPISRLSRTTDRTCPMVQYPFQGDLHPFHYSFISSKHDKNGIWTGIF